LAAWPPLSLDAGETRTGDGRLRSRHLGRAVGSHHIDACVRGVRGSRARPKWRADPRLVRPSAPGRRRSHTPCEVEQAASSGNPEGVPRERYRVDRQVAGYELRRDRDPSSGNRSWSRMPNAR